MRAAASRSKAGYVDLEGPLAPRKGVEVRSGPGDADLPQQAFDAACRLPQGHAKQRLPQKPRLDSVTVARLLAAPLPVGRTSQLVSGANRIDQEPSHQAMFTGRPEPRLVGPGLGAAHADQIPR